MFKVWQPTKVSVTSRFKAKLWFSKFLSTISSVACSAGVLWGRVNFRELVIVYSAGHVWFGVRVDDAKWLYRKPITSYRQVCIDRTVSIWTDLSCCRYDAFSKVFIASLIASVNKSTLKETQALFARFVSRIEIKIKDYNEPNYHNEMLIKPGGIWYLQTKKNQANKATVGRKSNEICFLVFGV